MDLNLQLDLKLLHNLTDCRLNHTRFVTLELKEDGFELAVVSEVSAESIFYLVSSIIE